MYITIMVTFLISLSGDIQKVSETEYNSLEECVAHAHQKEFTDRSDKGSYMYVCENQLIV